MTDEERIQRFGEKGLENLKAQAELLNMSLDQMEAIADVAPVALLEMLEEAMLRKQRDQYMKSMKIVPSEIDYR